MRVLNVAPVRNVEVVTSPADVRVSVPVDCTFNVPEFMVKEPYPSASKSALIAAVFEAPEIVILPAMERLFSALKVILLTAFKAPLTVILPLANVLLVTVIVSAEVIA